MDEARLSPQERRILAEIEHGLGEDQHLARRLRAGRPGLGTRRLATGPVAALLGVAAVTLFVTAVATEAPALIWAFAAVWVLTLVCVLQLLIRWSHRHLSGNERPRPDQEDAP
ncbi:DUF3040 domain-containing protein [Streptomyces sp. NPDC085481]|uniref:DUF3040 domain-containing protein n=1 Tax=Streptomyces sp. NPDC085481 TaxID=3365727 RepID=UPI0037D7B737